MLSTRAVLSVLSNQVRSPSNSLSKYIVGSLSNEPLTNLGSSLCMLGWSDLQTAEIFPGAEPHRQKFSKAIIFFKDGELSL